jgi:hypothetical protein
MKAESTPAILPMIFLCFFEVHWQKTGYSRLSEKFPGADPCYAAIAFLPKVFPDIIQFLFGKCRDDIQIELPFYLLCLCLPIFLNKKKTMPERSDPANLREEELTN